MQVLGGASPKDSFRIPKEMAADLVDGNSIEEVAAKPYKFTLERIFWANKGTVPESDPHWCTLPVLTWA